MRKSTLLWTLVLFTGLNIFLSFNYHSHAPRHSYHGSLWADRAGYFVYLPGLFQYGFQASAFPAGLDTLTGRGFSLDMGTGRVKTKYTSGVAMLQAPVYLACHGIAAILGIKQDAFGDVDHVVVSISGPLFASLGLLMLFGLLRRRANDLTTLLLLVVLFAGTNLFYYAVCDPGMSHIYSFFLFACCLVLWEYLRELEKTNWGDGLLTGALIACILLVRPTNLLFLIASFCASITTIREFRRMIGKMLSTPFATAAIAAVLVIWVPQLLYWKFTFDTTLPWTYTGEGFTEWKDPHLMEFLFSTNNGLFPYAPLFGILLLGSFYLWRSGYRVMALSHLTTFLIVTYLGSSWWVWHFGCGFGSRTMVEYTALYAPALFAFHDRLRTPMARTLGFTLLSLMILAEMKMVYSYGSCWFHGDWNWHAYAELLFGPTK